MKNPHSTPMSEDQLVTYCNQEAARSIHGIEDDSPEIAEALDYFFGRVPSITKLEQRDINASDIVSMDIMDGVEHTVAEVMPTFLSEEIAYFEPLNEQDEEQAQLETDLVNYLFMEEYNGQTVIQVALKDALLHKNGVCKVFWDERARVSYETFENVPAFALPEILQPNAEDQTVEIIEQIVDGEKSQQQPVTDGVSVGVVVDTVETYSIKIKRITRIEKPCIESVPPEETLICGDHFTPYLDNVRFIAQERLETESSLIEQGFDPEMVKMLPEYSLNLEHYSRARQSEEFDFNSRHHSTRLIKIKECYPLIDFDGDGIAERRKVVLSENTLLSNDEWDVVPLISGVSTIMPHKYQGISMFERLKDIQKTKTPLIRAIVDNAKLSANPRTGIMSGQVNVDDLLMSRTGGIVRMTNPNAIVPIPGPQVSPVVFETLKFLDNQRRERGGGSIDHAAQSQQISNDTAHGTERVMTAMELHNANVARTFGDTFVRGVFLELHRILRKHMKKDVTAKIGGRWVTSNPKEWGERSKIKVTIGSSQSERQRQAAVMQNVLNMHEKLYAMKAPLVSIDKSYRAMIDTVRLSGINGAEKYFVDPNSDEGKKKQAFSQQESNKEKAEQDKMQATMVQAQAKIAQAELQKSQAEQANVALDAENDRLKAQLEAIKIDSDISLKKQKLDDDYSVNVTKLELEANKQLSEQVSQNVNR